MPKLPLEPGRWSDIYTKEVRPNSWRARTTYRDFTGATREPESWGKTKAIAKRRLEDKLHKMSGAENADGVVAITSTTRMDRVIDEWVRERKQEGEDGITSQSLITYGSTIKNHIRPGLGQLRVREVTPVAVNRLLATLHAAAKYDTARQVNNVLTQIMGMCVRYGAITANPVRDAAPVRKPRRRKEVRTLSLEEVATLRAAVRSWENRPAKRGVRNITLLPEIVDTMLGTGLRIGEVLALREDDLQLDGDAPTLTVNGTVVRAEAPDATGKIRRRLIRQPKPKTDSSRHTVTLPGFVVIAMRTALDLALDGGPDGLLFPSTSGTVRSPGRVREQLKEALDGTGVTVRPHDFRRTVADHIHDELDTKTAAAQLGHSSEATTLRHYVRRKNIAPDVRTVLDMLIGGTPKPSTKVDS
ncbi:site-specific integrase [Myceligenerans salitolerans]|uniref:Tyrosine-type recombinase/integrase n=1 Tax=Myceligenerans salitolerans TaxID=1230528 RepID=A0ABS3IDH8_9MICO|nr:tyrosine-type recombinase/integrase [Myceligenerans salitolerans]MBO0611095.1 tyrosine-type recombinase/integrase [Myceligenerans salitolerans]